MTVATVLVVFTAAGAGAQVSCGDTISKGQTVTLTADVGPCDGDIVDRGFGLRVEGGTLDLGGHTVTCVDTNGDHRIPDGIVLRAKRSKVMNGTIVGCRVGLIIEDGSKHQVIDVMATNGSDGFRIDGDRNTLSGLVATGASTGVAIHGKRNTLSDIVATDNYLGIEIHGNRNKLSGVLATGSGDGGIVILSKGNRLSGAVATGNSIDGFFLFVDAENNKLTGCESSGNGSGFVVHGHRNRLKDSIANDNTWNGFAFRDSGNSIRGGSAHGNGRFDLNNCYRNRIAGLDYTTESDCPE